MLMKAETAQRMHMVRQFRLKDVLRVYILPNILMLSELMLDKFEYCSPQVMACSQAASDITMYTPLKAPPVNALHFVYKRYRAQEGASTPTAPKTTADTDALTETRKKFTL